MKRSLLLVPVVIVLVGGLVSCSDGTPGQPLPAQTTGATGSGGPFPTGATKTPSTASSQPNASASPLKDVQPCSLLSPAEAAGLRAGSGTAQRLNNARTCRFLQAEGFSMSVAIFDELGLDDIVAKGAIMPVPTVGKHKAARWIGGVDTCAISMEITKTTRVDAQGTSDDGNEQKSCEIAMQVAKFVEARLPQ